MTLKSAEVLEIRKKCIRCSEMRDASEFWPEKRYGDGLASTCKICANKRRNELFTSSPERRKRKYQLNIKNKHTPPAEQVCCRCGITKVIGQFYKNRANPHGYQYACKECVANKHKNKYRTDPEFRKIVIKRATDRNRKTKYGVSPEDFKARLLAQNGGCAICGKILDESSRGLIGHVDHNHETGKTRGILCSNCNTGLGVFKENRKFLLKAINYLSYYGGDNE